MKHKLISCPTCHTTGCVYNNNPEFPYPYAQCKTCNGNGYIELAIKHGEN